MELNKDTIKLIIETEIHLTPSAEQTDILYALLNRENVIVNAVAGSGKTTLTIMLAICLKYFNPNAKILLLTYNKELQLENEKKINQFNLSEIIDAKTFHGFGYGLYLQNNYFKPWNNGPFSDNGLTELMLTKPWFKLNEKQQAYSYLILDEVQDLEITKIAFVKMLLTKWIITPTMLIIGDKKQTIYQFMGSSSAFIEELDTVYDKFSFHKLNLSQSFRVPNNLCEIFNKYFIKAPWIVGTKTTGDLYIVDNSIQSYLFAKITAFIKDKIQNENATYNDFFILAFRKDTVRDLSNYLTANDLPVFFKTNENEKTTAAEIKNKIYLGSIHSSKGRERKYVLIPYFDTMNFANWLTEYKARNSFETDIPNLHYVGITRTKKDLFLGMNYVITNTPAKQIRNVFDIFKGYSELNPYIDWKGLINESHDNEHLHIDNIAEIEDLIADKLFWRNTVKKNLTNKLILNSNDAGAYASPILENEINELLKPISYKYAPKGGLLSDYNLHIPNSVKYDNKVFTTIVGKLNGFYFLFYSLRYGYPELFINEVLKWKATVDDFEKFIKENSINADNKSIYPYYKKWIESGLLKSLFKEPLIMWDKLYTSDKLNLLNLILSVKTNDYSNLQLQKYDWLDNFNNYEAIIDLFKSLELKDFVYEFGLTMLFSKTNQEIGAYLPQIGNKLLSRVKEINFPYNTTHLSELNLTGMVNLFTESRIYNLISAENVTFEDTVKSIVDLYIFNKLHKALTNFDLKLVKNRSEFVANMEKDNVSDIYKPYRGFYQMTSELSDNEYFELIKTIVLIKINKEYTIVLNYKHGNGVVIRNDHALIETIVKKIIDFKALTVTDKSANEIKREIYTTYHV